MELDKWRGTEIAHRLRVSMVSPRGFAAVGELDVTGASLTEEYGSDARVSAEVDAADITRYQDLAAIRLWHTATWPDGSMLTELLGTFFVHDIAPSWQSGAEPGKLTLGSTLWAMSVDQQMYAYTVPEGARAVDVFRDLCGRCMRDCSVSPDVNDYRFGAVQVWDAGESHLAHLYHMTDASGNRIDVQPDGVITLSRYTAPHDRTPAADVAWDDPLVIADGISMESDDGEVPGRVGVQWDYRPDGSTDSQTIAAFADVDGSSRYSIGRRGYRVAELVKLTDVDSASVADAQWRAAQQLAQQAEATTKWTVPMRWCDLHEGDVIRWCPPSGGWRKCLVTSAEKDLTAWMIKLTLKEV